ncbi:hypothetical protein WA171_002046 [Blastocystis sp. BT1]
MNSEVTVVAPDYPSPTFSSAASDEALDAIATNSRNIFSLYGRPPSSQDRIPLSSSQMSQQSSSMSCVDSIAPPFLSLQWKNMTALCPTCQRVVPIKGAWDYLGSPVIVPIYHTRCYLCHLISLSNSFMVAKDV